MYDNNNKVINSLIITNKNVTSLIFSIEFEMHIKFTSCVVSRKKSFQNKEKKCIWNSRYWSSLSINLSILTFSPCFFNPHSEVPNTKKPRLRRRKMFLAAPAPDFFQVAPALWLLIFSQGAPGIFFSSVSGSKGPKTCGSGTGYCLLVKFGEIFFPPQTTNVKLQEI